MSYNFGGNPNGWASGQLAITAAPQMIPFPTNFPTNPQGNPQPPSLAGMRRKIYATQPIFVGFSANMTIGAGSYYVPAGEQFDCTLRSPIWYMAANGPFAGSLSSSSISPVPTINSSSSLSPAPTSGYSSSSSSASPYSSSSQVPVPVYQSSSSPVNVSTFGLLFAVEETG